MYDIKQTENSNPQSLTVSNTNGTDTLVINLNEGGRVALFKHKGITIISDLKDASYSQNYAAAILFPFANRIENGEYNFNASNYKLKCNEEDKNNAIHGLVYNKTFKLVSSALKKDVARLVLSYQDNGICEGFPFKFSIWLTYTLNKESLSLEVKIKNDHNHAFPFTLGWHPYFITSDLKKSQLRINAEEKFIANCSGIVTDKDKYKDTMSIQLGKAILDDAYKVNSHMAELLTPEYKVKLQTASKENYLQIYTPEHTNSIAIEPMVGVSNSFNNNIGLSVLRPKEIFEKEWTLTISKN